jgi:hypothetical protein
MLKRTRNISYPLRCNKIKWGIVCAVAVSFLLLIVVGVISVSNTIQPGGIVVHHSAIPFPADGSPINETTLDEIHKRRGYGIFYWGKTYHIGYHYVILTDGTLQKGRPDHCRGSHTKGFNNYIGICLVGNFSKVNTFNGTDGPSQPTAEQLRTLRGLIVMLQAEYNIPQNQIYSHKDLNPNTECPGDDFISKYLFLKQ